MPQRVNGCGTWYYGKKDVHSYTGTCQACHRQATLTSYDTRLWVSILLVPVIPLAKKHIIEECAICRRHGAVALAEWMRVQARAHDAIDAYHALPNDPKLAEDALRASVGYRDRESFLALAPMIEEHLAADSKTQVLVASAYNLFGRLGDAERVLRAALALGDSDDLREALAKTLMNNGKPNEAEPYLAHVVEKGVPDRVNLLYQLAQHFQAKGNHVKALQYFEYCEAINPGIARDTTFAQLRDATKKNLGTTRVVKPNEIVRRARTAASTRKTLKIIGVAAVIALMGYFVLAWIMGQRQPVYVVNGLSKPYTAKINGTSYMLSPGMPVYVRVPQGQVTVEIVGAPASVPAETLTIETPLISRPFNGQTFVINPDHGAILERQRIAYVPQSRTGSAPQPQIHYTVGKTLHAIDDVDYPFTTPPKSLTTESSGEVWKVGLVVSQPPPDMTPEMVLAALSKELGPQAITAALERRLLLEPDAPMAMLSVLSMNASPRELADFLRPSLADRPLRVHRHRTYQDAMSRLNLEEQARREYDAMLAKEPANGDLMYLVARAERDPEKARALCEKAAAGSAPSGYACYWLAGFFVETGEFKKSIEYGEQALKLLPHEAEVRHCLQRALMADGQFDRALAELQPTESGPILFAASALLDEVYVHTRTGNKNAVTNDILRLQAKMLNYGPETGEQYKKYANAVVAYCSGDTAGYVALMESDKDAESQAAAHLTTLNFVALEKDLAEIRPALGLLATTFVATSMGRRNDLADRQLKALVDALSKGPLEHRLYAEALSGSSTVSPEKFVKLRVNYDDKPQLLIAVAIRNPKLRDACYAMAKTLNFDTRFPYLILQRALDGHTE